MTILQTRDAADVCAGGAATTVYNFKSINDKAFSNTQLDFSGRSSGVITIKVKSYGGDTFMDTETATSVDLSTEQNVKFLDAAIMEFEVTVPAGDSVNCLVTNW